MSIIERWFRRRTPVREHNEPLPLLHDAGTANWGLEAGVLAFIDELVSRDSVTAETGIGMSTVLLAGKGCEHYAITSSEAEVAEVQTLCHQRGIDDSKVRFMVGNSQDVLPHLTMPALDVAIIDGGHGMPIPFVDWCYLAPRLKVGGILVVDDVWIWTGAVLRDFMRAEWQWELVRTFGKAVAFRKKQDPVMLDWGGQPYLMARSRVPPDWKWNCNTLHGHIAAIDATLAQIERQGKANAETIDNLQWVEGELLDCVRRIEGICARKAAET